MITRIIGIDFGTSSTVVKVFNNGAEASNSVYTLSVGNGMQEIPTIIFERKIDGALFVADEALSQLNQAVEGTIHKNFKLNLISDNETEKDKAIEFTTLFFKYLKKRYDEMCNIGTFGQCDTTKVFVSYPAKWPSFVRLTMLECAIKAGFGTSDTVFGLDEPTAAAVASFNERESELKRAGLFYANTTYKAMMIDMGAGTTDIVLFEYRIENNQLHINNPVTYPTAESERLCGGREIDDILSEYCLNYCRSIPMDGNVPQGFIDKCNTEIKPWKEEIVSRGLKDNLEIKSPGFITQLMNLIKQFGLPLNPKLKPFLINRLTFESITQVHWQNWRNMIEEAFKEGKKFGYKSPDDINIIILNGGHSQWYGVKDFFMDKPFARLKPISFGLVKMYEESLIQSIKPSQTVATGLCLRDKAIVAATPLSNSFWIQFKYEGKTSKIIKIADKGHSLPFESSIDAIKDSITGNFIYRRSFNIECIVYEGNSLETAKKHIKSVVSPNDDLVSVIFKAAVSAFVGAPLLLAKFGLDFLSGNFDINEYKNALDNDYAIQLGANIHITEDGIATVSPEITVDENKLNLTPIKL